MSVLTFGGFDVFIRKRESAALESGDCVSQQMHGRWKDIFFSQRVDKCVDD